MNTGDDPESIELQRFLLPISPVEIVSDKFLKNLRQALQTQSHFSMKDFIAVSCPENELILDCSRTELPPELIEHVKMLLKGDIDWQYVIGYVNHHGITQLLYRSIEQINSVDIPRSVLDYLQRFCHNNSIRNLRLTHELILLLNLFSAHNISVIPFKGPILSVLAYHNIALRQFGDLDLLIRKKDFFQTQALLMNNGYRLGILTQDQRKDLDFHSGEIPFVNQDSHAVVDLHWKISPKFFPFKIDVKNWCIRQQSITLNGVNTLTFCLEDTLLYLCIHAAIHLWVRLEWLCDIAELVRSYQSQIDWKKVLKQSHEVGCDRILLLNCYLIRRLLGVHLPDLISDKISVDKTLKPLAQDIQSFIFPQPNQAEPLGRKEGLFVFIKMRERPWHQLIHLIYIMNRSGWATPSTKDREVFKLPKSLTFLYWFIRPLRLFQDYKMTLRRFYTQ